jgi:AGZA family xanthine/uracil permease-like MFS transporter
MLERFFNLKANGTTFHTEIVAGLTTFMTMAYILAVNPNILSATGMNKGAVFTATALASFIAILVMALWAKLPFGLAPGMGLNAFFAFTVVLGMGYSWQFALTAVFIEGIIFLMLTLFNIREAIVDSIPINLKHAVSTGIGLFIAFIGLSNAGIIVSSEATLVELGNLGNSEALVALTGLIIIGVLLVFRVKGALLIGVLLATAMAVPLNITSLPQSGWIDTPPSIEPLFFKFEFHNVFTMDMLVVLFTFLFVDMFDTIGTLVGVTSKAGMLDAKGKVPRAKQALFADAIGTTFGAMLGTSTVTTYVESASGVAEGGRTGLTSLVVGAMFLLALFFGPVFTMIPSAATAPALIVVGLFMMGPIRKINLDDYSEAIPAFLTIIMMPLTYSIAEGIAFGIITFVLLKLFTGKSNQISWVTIAVAVFFLMKFVLDILRDYNVILQE